ncbi:helicase-related protein [Streptomyces olivaceoviridis]
MHAADPELYPRTIWADWLCGDHKPGHRRRVLGEFASGIATDGTVVEKGFLGSVKVLGEGVDTKNCDSVYRADVRGSMPDLVQAVGRALRMQPGEGKMASLVVPVLLGPGETADNMVTSRAFGGLAKLVEALRAHDDAHRSGTVAVLSQGHGVQCGHRLQQRRLHQRHRFRLGDRPDPLLVLRP